MDYLLLSTFFDLLAFGRVIKLGKAALALGFCHTCRVFFTTKGTYQLFLLLQRLILGLGFSQ
jgi:hypothetical protein